MDIATVIQIQISLLSFSQYIIGEQYYVHREKQENHPAV